MYFNMKLGKYIFDNSQCNLIAKMKLINKLLFVQSVKLDGCLSYSIWNSVPNRIRNKINYKF